MSIVSRKSVLVAAAFSAVSGAYASAQAVQIYGSPVYVGGTGGAGGFQAAGTSTVPKNTTGSASSDVAGSSVITGSSLVSGYIYYPSSTGSTPVLDSNNIAAYIINNSGTPVRLASAAYTGTPPSGSTAPSSLGTRVTPYAINAVANLVVGSSTSSTGSPIAAEWNASTGAITTFGTQNSNTSSFSTVGSSGSYYQFAEAVNASGVAAGSSYLYVNGSNGGNAPVVWTSAGSAPILLPNEGTNSSGGYSGTVFGVNSSATIVGSIYNYSGTSGGTYIGTNAMAWTASAPGVYTAVVLPSAATTNTPSDGAKVINDNGVIAGYTSTASGNTAARWTPSGSGYVLQQLNSVGTSSASSTYLGGLGDISAINAAGDVVGSAAVYTTAATTGPTGTPIAANASIGTRPLLWLTGSSTPVQLQVDGTSTTGVSDYYAGSHSGGNLTAAVYGLNAADFSVGEAVKYNSSGIEVVPSTATLWNSSGALTELNSLIGITSPTDSGQGFLANGVSGWTNLYQADGITDTGWISGYGYYYDATGNDTYERGFLIYDAAAAVPEPTSLTMLALSGVGLLRRKRRSAQAEIV